MASAVDPRANHLAQQVALTLVVRIQDLKLQKFPWLDPILETVEVYNQRGPDVNPTIQVRGTWFAAPSATSSLLTVARPTVAR